LPKRLTFREAKDLGLRLIRHDSLEPIQDGLRDTIFQGRAEHIPMEAPILGDLDEEGPVTEETNPMFWDPEEGMVKKGSMALDRWFPAAPASRGKVSALSTP